MVVIVGHVDNSDAQNEIMANNLIEVDMTCMVYVESIGCQSTLCFLLFLLL